MSKEKIKEKKPIIKKWWFWLIVALFIFYIIGSTSTPQQPSTPTPKPTTSPEQKPSNDTNTSDAKQPDSSKKEEYINTAESATLFSGTFSVGEDINEGRYVVTTSSGSGNLFVKDASGIPVVNEILATSQDESLGLGVTSVEIELSKGQTVEISGLNEVTFDPATIELKTTLSSGTHLVGRDVPAGSYIATAPTGSGNFFVLSSNGIPVVNEILGKDDFGMAVEKVKVSIKDGQTISISGLESVVLE